MYLFTSQPRHQKLDLPWFVGSVAASRYKISFFIGKNGNCQRFRK
jgi:hypothetical protein